MPCGCGTCTPSFHSALIASSLALRYCVSVFATATAAASIPTVCTAISMPSRLRHQSLLARLRLDVGIQPLHDAAAPRPRDADDGPSRHAAGPPLMISRARIL